MDWLVEILSWALIVGGSLCILIGGIGVLRFPDVYTRMHAASITDTMGAGLLLGGLIVQAGWTLVAGQAGHDADFPVFHQPDFQLFAGACGADQRGRTHSR